MSEGIVAVIVGISLVLAGLMLIAEAKRRSLRLPK